MGFEQRNVRSLAGSHMSTTDKQMNLIRSNISFILRKKNSSIYCICTASPVNTPNVFGIFFLGVFPQYNTPINQFTPGVNS